MKTTLTKLRAENYRRSFYKFSLEAFKVLHNGDSMVENWHIEYVCNKVQSKVQKVLDGEVRDKHLIINVPPRTLKSELVNVFLSVWIWINDDSKKFISTSYASRLSTKHSKNARRIITSDWFKQHYPHIQITQGENTQTEFTTPNGGNRYSTSTGGVVTGIGGDVIVIDDPQDPEEARSDKKRESANEYFTQTLSPRLDDPEVGLFIIIMQRLHELDLTGYLLETEPEEWEHICLPAELTDNVIPSDLKDFYEENKLFPQRLTEKVLNAFKKRLGSYGYAGQMLQLPSPAEGGMLKRDWFEVINELPKDKNDNPIQLSWNFFLDTAYTDKTYNDATSMLAAAYHEEKVYIRNVEAVRLEFPELVKKIQEFVHANGYTNRSRIHIEPKASGKSIVQQLKRNTGLNVIEDKPPTQDKVSRVNSISPIIEAGRVKLLNGRYIDSFLNECAAFPNATHDDQVDTLVMAVDKFTVRSKRIKAVSL